jgi:hypothetical protein
MEGRATRNQKRQIRGGSCDETLVSVCLNSEAGTRRELSHHWLQPPEYGTRVPRTRARARASPRMRAPP